MAGDLHGSKADKLPHADASSGDDEDALSDHEVQLPPGMQVFSMADDDEEAEDAGQHEMITRPLLDIEHDPAAASSGSQAPGLNADELKQYDEIEQQFQKFKARQHEVERNVSALLERLNTKIRVPSSIASSECGDLTSMASSEWDTESLGPTEDGLSILGSRVGSRVGSRAGTPPLGSPIGSPRGEHRSVFPRSGPSLSSLGLPGMPWPPQSSDWRSQSKGMGSSSSTAPAPENRSGEMERHLEHKIERPVGVGSGTGHTGGERGDLLDVRGSDSSRGNNTFMRSPSGQLLPKPTSSKAEAASLDAPRLTSQLLATAELQQAKQQSWLTPREQPAQDELAEPACASSAAPFDLPRTAQLPAATLGKEAANLLASRLPQFGTNNLSDPPSNEVYSAEEEELARWQGWTVVATPEGRLFFHNEIRQDSQWNQPPELASVLGEWVEAVDESQPSKPTFWRNELLRISLWKDPRPTTNIFQAALDGNLFFMQLYAEVEGQLDVVDHKGCSALHYSCAGGATTSATFLLQRSAEVDRRDENEATPLIFACRYGYASVVKVLLDSNADLNSANVSGNTALHEAASMGQLDCLHLLLLFHANATLVNKQGDLAVDIAAKKRHYSCTTLLRRYDQSATRVDAPWQRPVVDTLSAAAAPLGTEKGADTAPLRRNLGNPSVSMEVPSTTSSGETDPLGTLSSSDACFANSAAPADRARGTPADAGEPQPLRRRKAGEPPKVEYVGKGNTSDSDLDAVAEACLEREGTDSGGASSESSDGGQGQPGRPRGRGRRRERSPVALGLLSRMQGVTGFIGRARRWAFPVKADLGLPNMYQYNRELQRWELNGQEGAELDADD